MSTESLLQRLDNAQPVVRRRDMYFRGDQPLRFMAGKVDPKIMGFKSNLAKVAVNAVAERIRLEDVTAMVDGRDVTDRARKLVRDADLPMLMQAILVDMLAVGSAYMIVWVDEFGRPVVTGESAEEVAVERDPITRGVTAAIKRWTVTDAAGMELETHVVKYLPTEIVHLIQTAKDGKLRFLNSTPNPLGVVPVVPLINVERIGDDVGTSVVDDLAPLLDALNKTFMDMMTTSEAVARPKRYATGVDLEEDEVGFEADGFEADGFEADGGEVLKDPEVETARAPFSDADDMWVSEQAEAKFGQLPGADMSGYRVGVELIVQQIMAVSSLPGHLVGITTSNPATAEALRASEVALASAAHGRVRVVNRPVEWAVRLLVAIDQGVSPDRVEVRLRWADTATRSVAAAADAAVKMHAEGITDNDEARAMVGAGEEL